MTISSPPPPNPGDRDLVDAGDAPLDDGDRSSITDVNGSIARFEMTYSPPTSARRKFNAPLRVRLPSFGYLAFASILSVIVAWGYNAPTNSRVFIWVVEGDRSRPLSAQVLATIIAVSAVATVLRAHMRGVVISSDWIEARYLLALGIPKTSRWGWPQVNRMIFDHDSIALELMDGSWERLPEVSEPATLRAFLRAHGAKRNIQITELERA